MTVKYDDSDYNTYLVSYLDVEEQRKSYVHGVKCIEAEHFSNEGSVEQKEKIVQYPIYEEKVFMPKLKALPNKRMYVLVEDDE